MVTASEDRSLCLWDLSSDGKYRRHWQAKELHGYGLRGPLATDAAYASPMAGQRLDADVQTAPSSRRTVSSVQEGAMVRCPQPPFSREGHGHWVTCVHMDWASSLVYSGSMDRTVKVWDIYSARCLRTYHAGGDWITGIHVRRDVVFTTGEDGYIRLWKAHPHLAANADDQEVALGELEGHGEPIKQLLAPSRDCLLTGDAGGNVGYWNLALGTTKDECLQASAKASVGIVSCLALPYHDQQAGQWSRRRRPLRLTPATRTLPKPTHTQTPLNADAQQLQGQGVSITAVVGGHLGIEMWELVPLFGPGVTARGSYMVRRFGGHSGGVTCMSVVDGSLFTGSEDGTVRAWALDSGNCLQVYQGHLSGVRCLRIMTYAELSGLGGQRETKTGAADCGATKAAAAAASASDMACHGGGMICSGACDLRLWDMDSGDVVAVLSKGRVDALEVAVPGLVVAASKGLVASFGDLPTHPPSALFRPSSVIRPSVWVQGQGRDEGAGGRC